MFIERERTLYNLEWVHLNYVTDPCKKMRCPINSTSSLLHYHSYHLKKIM